MLNHASNVSSEKLVLWQEPTTLLGFMGTIMISGDFNKILSLDERFNGYGFTTSIFTSSRKTFYLAKHGLQSIIDICLILANAETCWLDMVLLVLPGSQSDHLPICFCSTNVFYWGLKAFCSVEYWWDYDKFGLFMEESWRSICSSNPNPIQRLKEFRHKLRDWNSEIFGDQNKRIQELSAQLLSTNLAAELGTQIDEERVIYVNVRAEFWKAEKNVNSMWMQKSRVKWNDEGDRNTKFLHSISSAHYRNNHIFSILVDRITFSKPKNIRFHIRNFYNSLYSRAKSVSIDITSFNFDEITDGQAISLLILLIEAEICNITALCGAKTSHGLDGFFFYQKSWFVMKGEITDFFKRFHDFCTLPKGINSSYMVLIPKVVGSSIIKDCHPTSLLNGFYKMLSKSFSKRLAPILSGVISDC
ncbi:uncharacterized protein LOC126661663 [Mercurialis annua]|uniref:uncharacterized protein LOC126661663 n=1 Tax=Mercurialis annua TaxID=3986 RepID=UPI002160A15B|nr:uncharacterized protein LOC126661663 [Mercurialis annua]